MTTNSNIKRALEARIKVLENDLKAAINTMQGLIENTSNESLNGYLAEELIKYIKPHLRVSEKRQCKHDKIFVDCEYCQQINKYFVDLVENEEIIDKVV